MLDSRFDQDVPVETVAGDLLAAEVLAQAVKCLGVLVHHGHSVIEPFQGRGQGGPDPAAAHDHHVHDLVSSLRGVGSSGTTSRSSADRTFAGADPDRVAPISFGLVHRTG